MRGLSSLPGLALVMLVGSPGCGDDVLWSPEATSAPALPGRAAPATQATGRYLPGGAPWYRDVSQARVSPESQTITSWMVAQRPPGGWGGGGRMQIDFSLVAVDVPAGTPRRRYVPVPDFTYSPDCDSAPVPLPPGGAVEGTDGVATSFSGPLSGYACGGFDRGEDCHLLLLSRSERRLYEIYHGTVDSGGVFRAGCLAIWDTGATGDRGQQCTSADAAGFPIAPLLFTPEEVQRGAIEHAIRFILPNSMIRQRKYVAPATHGTGTTGPAQAGPYGFRLRLRADYPLSSLGPGAQVVARALQRYGMLLADGGNIALTAQSDVLSSVKWRDVGLDSMSLAALRATDFEVIDFGATTDVTNDCVRTPIQE